MLEFIEIPTETQLDKVVKDFQNKWGFPQCGGAIGKSHIPVKAPAKYYIDYYNRKGWYLIILQAVVDSSYKFIDINVGWPGKVHDARVFSNSSVYEKGSNGSLFSATRSKKINFVDVPIFIIADGAYPLLPWAMKPFKDNDNLAKDKAHDNCRLSTAIIVVENAFGRLKGRWRGVYCYKWKM